MTQAGPVNQCASLGESLDACRECGERLADQRAGFCSKACRSRWHNRRAARGAKMYDLVMAIRFDREAAEAAGAWSLLCRMASHFRSLDERDRNGRPSWETLDQVKGRSARFSAKVVGVNVAGAGRSRS